MSIQKSNKIKKLQKRAVLIRNIQMINSYNISQLQNHIYTVTSRQLNFFSRRTPDKPTSENKLSTQ
ncbi:hypothetical protein C2G38_2124007 [Gigaspora rosea]|uniref:Uncharacterized protein n=1 Tax=Gigaspora rosea TaxID=44941 RepID=A0A397TYE1_9GLOM|nr:hypothetical protein C2G38_2124007 [Gigaspora rosea]